MVVGAPQTLAARRLTFFTNYTWEEPSWPITVTSYNPDYRQTDGSPCISASLKNICDMAERGERIIGLSSELVGRASWKPFTYGEYLIAEHDNPACSGVFRVEDVMNPRWKNRGDVFLLNRSNNFGKCRNVMIHRSWLPIKEE